MAEEKIETLPDPPAMKSGGNPWLPVLTLIIVLPAISYAMVEYLIVPKLQETLQTTHTADAHGAKAKASGGSHGSSKSDGHGGGHGGDAHAGNQAEFDNIVANLSGSLRSRYVKVSFIVIGDEEDFGEVIEGNRIKLIDATIGVLSVLSIRDLEEPGIKNIIRNNLIAAFDSTLGYPLVSELYFSEFVVQ